MAIDPLILQGQLLCFHAFRAAGIPEAGFLLYESVQLSCVSITSIQFAFRRASSCCRACFQPYESALFHLFALHPDSGSSDSSTRTYLYQYQDASMYENYISARQQEHGCLLSSSAPQVWFPGSKMLPWYGLRYLEGVQKSQKHAIQAQLLVLYQTKQPDIGVRIFPYSPYSVIMYPNSSSAY